MGIFDWLKRSGGAVKGADLPSAEDLAFEPGKEEVAGLNFKTAIDAHMKWKQRLKAVIEGSSGPAVRFRSAASCWPWANSTAASWGWMVSEPKWPIGKAC